MCARFFDDKQKQTTQISIDTRNITKKTEGKHKKNLKRYLDS